MFFNKQDLFQYCNVNTNDPQKTTMNELLDRLIKDANLDAEQAKKAIETIAAFVKEKFPMLGGAVDQIFSAGNKEDQGV